MKYPIKIKKMLAEFFVNPTARVLPPLIGGAMMNLIYIATNAASSIIYHSIWSAALTIYHLTLIVIRIYLLYSGRVATGDGGRHVCLRVGVLLMLLDLAAAAIMIYSTRHSSYASYSGMFLIGFLAFTVYSLVRSAVDVKRYRDGTNHLYFTAKSISLSTSLMSVFNLQYSLLVLLGADNNLSSGAIFLCGAAVFSIILFLSFGLIRRGVDRGDGSKF